MSESLTPKQILECGIAGMTTMRLELLKSASRDGGSRIPSRWSSNKLYAELEKEGLVREGHDVTVGWQRQWLITEAGRATLSSAERSSTT